MMRILNIENKKFLRAVRGWIPLCPFLKKEV
jgi:hypothetical protein